MIQRKISVQRRAEWTAAGVARHDGAWDRARSRQPKACIPSCMVMLLTLPFSRSLRLASYLPVDLLRNGVGAGWPTAWRPDSSFQLSPGFCQRFHHGHTFLWRGRYCDGMACRSLSEA